MMKVHVTRLCKLMLTLRFRLNKLNFDGKETGILYFTLCIIKCLVDCGEKIASSDNVLTVHPLSLSPLHIAIVPGQ